MHCWGKSSFERCQGYVNRFWFPYRTLVKSIKIIFFSDFIIFSLLSIENYKKYQNHSLGQYKWRKNVSSKYRNVYIWIWTLLLNASTVFSVNIRVALLDLTCVSGLEYVIKYNLLSNNQAFFIFCYFFCAEKFPAADRFDMFKDNLLSIRISDQIANRANTFGVIWSQSWMIGLMKFLWCSHISETKKLNGCF